MNRLFFKKKYLNSKKGFSLLEMLVAIGIFMTIVTIAISALISIIGANKRAQAIKNTIDTVNFVIESMSRDIRSGTDYNCLLNNPSSMDCLLGNSEFQYKNSSGEVVTYIFNNPDDQSDILTSNNNFDYESEILIRKIGNNEDILISKDSGVNLDNMKFYVIGSDNENKPIGERTQPRVIITASGKIETKEGTSSSFNLQTTISQRYRR